DLLRRSRSEATAAVASDGFFTGDARDGTRRYSRLAFPVKARPKARRSSRGSRLRRSQFETLRVSHRSSLGPLARSLRSFARGEGASL
ncbi:hypothetical protein, partial [Haladaptatus sp. NG-SE-30]